MAQWRLSPKYIWSLAVLLRLILLVFGLVQDTVSPVPYTDIDYFVFTDAARFVNDGQSPYLRVTYRYTPLLAWLLVPTAWTRQASTEYARLLLFAWGKILFAGADLVAGWLMLCILRQDRTHRTEASNYKYVACAWLLNPMIATFSTRGSSEGLLGALVVAILWAVKRGHVLWAGVLLGLAVHLKIYPFIYGISILLSLPSSAYSAAKQSSRKNESGIVRSESPVKSSMRQIVYPQITRPRIILVTSSLITFTLLNLIMYILYGHDFLQHTFLHHLVRIDHRHNFSTYNTLLHLSSAAPSSTSNVHFEKLAFLPQLGLSLFLIPWILARHDLAGTMLCQTFAFVAFNKVVTSQYFVWYIVLVPFYLPYSSFLSSPKKGVLAIALWAGGQALWLYYAYQLEFHGQSTFFPELFSAASIFFVVNIWILGVMVRDVAAQKPRIRAESQRPSSDMTIQKKSA